MKCKVKIHCKSSHVSDVGSQFSTEKTHVICLCGAVTHSRLKKALGASMSAHVGGPVPDIYVLLKSFNGLLSYET